MKPRAAAGPPLTVYVIRGKKRPQKTKMTMDRLEVWPDTINHESQTFYKANADFVDNTITYVSVDPNWQ